MECVFSLMSIIDFLCNLAYGPLRFLRIFLLFRLLKILRYATAIKEFSSVFEERKFELFTLFILFSLVIFFFGSTVMFVYEGNGENERLRDYFDAVYWGCYYFNNCRIWRYCSVTIEGKLVQQYL